MLALALLGCERPSVVIRELRAPADQVPESTSSISGQTVSVGFQGSTLSGTETVESFRIAKRPVTIGGFGACAEAGACSRAQTKGCFWNGPPPLGGPNADFEDAELPVTCVGVRQAKQYCEWVGGTLPTLGQWLMAARGPGLGSFPWGGSDEATCEQHPDGVLPPPYDVNDERLQPFCGRRPEQYRVGLRPHAASATGMEDILLPRGELLRATERSPFQICNLTRNDACAVVSNSPGSIDWVLPVVSPERTPKGEPVPPATMAYAFRCVWGV